MRNNVVVAGILVIISGFALFLVSTISSTQEKLVAQGIPSFQKTVTVPYREYALIEKFVFDATLEGWTPYSIVFEHSDFSQYRANITDPDGSEIPTTEVYGLGWEYSFSTRKEGTYRFLVDGTYLTQKSGIDDTIDVSIYKLVERIETYYLYEILRYGAIGFWVVGIVISIVGLTRKKKI